MNNHSFTKFLHLQFNDIIIKFKGVHFCYWFCLAHPIYKYSYKRSGGQI